MKKRFTSLIFLAGGKGTRLNSAIPKQFIPINNKILALYSFDILCSLDEISEIIIVCEEKYQSFFENSKPIIFANPGERRQDSVFNGLQKTSDKSDFVVIHDSARPFIKKDLVQKLIQSTFTHRACAIGSKAVNTIKECNDRAQVIKTLNRSSLFEIHTPQAIEKNLLLKGYDFVNKHNLDVTDDVSIIEHLNHKVKIIEGPKDNIKITCDFDLKLAQILL